MADRDPAVTVFLDAADTFRRLVDRIDPLAWDRPGLGVWDLRALVGHTSRSLVTVLTYLDQPAESEDVDSPQRYYALVARLTTGAAATAIAERGRQAGADLGSRPAEAVRQLVDQVTARLAQANPEALITTIAGGMRVSHYLPTRTFELVVHGLDIAAATGLDVTFSPEVLRAATRLAGDTVVELDRAEVVLRALTGRGTLPEGFSIVG